MQATVVLHQALAPISEASSVVGHDQAEPRRSLHHLRPPPAPEQPRRYTMALAATAASAAAAAGSERLRPPGRQRIPSIRSGGRPSLAGGRQPAAGHVENTYRMGPRRLFQFEATEALVADRLAGMLQGYHYDPHSAPTLSRNLALEIKNKVKQACSADQQRYKLIALVTITEASAPAGLSATRALWSVETGDACARAEFRGTHVAASAAVFAFYCE